MKRRKKYILIGIIVGIVSFAILGVGLLTLIEKSTYESSISVNVSADTVGLLVYKNNNRTLPISEEKIFLGGDALYKCEDVEDGVVCIGDIIKREGYSLYSINHLSPSTSYSLQWADTFIGNISNSDRAKIEVTTVVLSEGAPSLERIYGRVIDENEEGVANSIVLVHNDHPAYEYPLATITNEDGSYQINYNKEADGNFLQEVEVRTASGKTVTYKTASFYNKPVADIVVEDEEALSRASDSPITANLVTGVEAANSCFTAKMGGIRVQCHDEFPWVDTLNVRDCPSNQSYFRLGMIQHTSVTSFYKPGTLTLKLFDVKNQKFVQDPVTKKDLTVVNGGYVDTKKIQFEIGEKYEIKAYDGATECLNKDGETPFLRYNTPAGRPVTSSSPPDFSNTTNIPPMTEQANLCMKMGENFAIGYQIPVDKMQQAVGLGMRWGEALIVDIGGVEEYRKSVANGRNVGLNVILRLCYKNNCNVKNGTEYGEAIVKAYNDLLATGEVPQQGLFVHVGHNEPNSAEYIDPNEEAQFIADTIKVLESASILSVEMEDIGVKAIGPNLDVIASNGNWPGCGDGSCDDPNPHPIYNASSYIDEMLKNGDFSSNAGKIYAWAGNTYVVGGSNPAGSVSAYSSYLGGKGFSPKVFVTELGSFSGDPDFTQLTATISELENNSNVEAILLFNSLGSNPDPAFEYHKKLWDNPDMIRQLYPSCKASSYQVPQEGSVGANYETGDGTAGASGSGANPYASSGAAVAAAAAGVGGGESNFETYYAGTDKCLDTRKVIVEGCDSTRVCDDQLIAGSGMINGDISSGCKWSYPSGSLNGDSYTYASGSPSDTVATYWNIWFFDDEDKPGTAYKKPRYTGGPDLMEDDRYLKPFASQGQYGVNAIYDAGIFQVIRRQGVIPGQEDIYVHYKADASVRTDHTFKVMGYRKSDFDVDPEETDNYQQEPQKVLLDSSEYTTDLRCKAQIGMSPVEYKLQRLKDHKEDPTEINWDNFDKNFESELYDISATKLDIELLPEDLAEIQKYNEGFVDVILRAYCGGGEKLDQEPIILTHDDEYTEVEIESYVLRVYWDHMKLYSIPAGGGEVVLLGDDTGLTENNLPTCTDTSTPGPDGSACFDPAIINPTQVLLDSELDQNILGAASITLPERGRYRLDSENYEFTNPYVYNFSDEPLRIPFFQDRDKDGIFDDDEFATPSTLDTRVTRVGDAMEFELKPGITMLSIPFYTQDFDQAVEILNQIKAQGGYATAVGSYQGGGGWNSTTLRGEQVYGDDYQVRPEDGIYLALQKPVKLRLAGQAYTAPVKQYLATGWNFMAIKGADEQLRASELLAQINDLPGVRATKLTIWDPQKGRFISYIKETDGAVYGDDFLVSESSALFVLVEEGVGYWTPE